MTKRASPKRSKGKREPSDLVGKKGWETMATWIVGGALLLMVGLILWKLVRDKRRGKGACACGGDCAHCRAACSAQPK